MTRNEFDAESLVEDFCHSLDSEETIEACRTIIKIAERILRDAESEIESEKNKD